METLLYIVKKFFILIDCDQSRVNLEHTQLETYHSLVFAEGAASCDYKSGDKLVTTISDAKFTEVP